MEPNVGRHRVETQLLHDLRAIDRRVLPRHDRFAPNHRVEVQIRETGRACLVTEALQGDARLLH